MKILIVGAGKVGKYLAESLSKNHTIILLDILEEKSALFEENPNIKVYIGDGCEPLVLEGAGVAQVDAVVAATGDDEDNLVISLLSKSQYKVKKVIARVNNPRNHWLFTKRWGVDVAISSPHIIHSLLEEELSIGDIVTLMKLKEGKLSVIETTVGQNSIAVDKTIAELDLPANSVVAVVLSEGRVAVPHGETELKAGDSLLIVTDPNNETYLNNIFAAKS